MEGVWPLSGRTVTVDFDASSSTELAGRDRLERAAILIGVSLKEMDPRKRLVSTSFAIYANNDLARILAAREPGSPLSGPIGPTPRGSIEVEIHDWRGSGRPVRRRFDARKAFGRPDDAVGLIRMPVTVESDASRYPSDIYRLEVSARARFVPERGTTQAIRRLPVGLGVYLDYGFTGMIAEAERQRGSREVLVSMVIKRSPSTVKFTYLLALAPGVLILIVLLSLFPPFLRAFPSLDLGVAVGLLAIFPLRTVLVPSEIPGITFLDRILTLEVLGIIALSACRYALMFGSQVQGGTRRRRLRRPPPLDRPANRSRP